MTFFLVWYQLVEQLHFLIKHESFNIVSSKHQDPLNTDFQNVTYFIHKDRIQENYGDEYKDKLSKLFKGRVILTVFDDKT